MGKQLSWKPFQPDHAIERVRIVVQFGGQLPTKFLRKLAADGEELRIELGYASKNLREGQQITLGPAGMNLGAQPSQLFGWDWRKLSPANSTLDVLVVEDRTLVFETVEYTRWRNFIEKFELVTLNTLNSITNVVDLKSFSLEYIDRFLFEGTAIEASPVEILRNIRDQIHENALSGQELWHLHKGWFEQLNNQKLLINQNIDAQNAQVESNETIRSIQILTKTELMFDQPPFNYLEFKPHLENMHNRSKELFALLLTNDMQEKVGL